MFENNVRLMCTKGWCDVRHSSGKGGLEHLKCSKVIKMILL